MKIQKVNKIVFKDLKKKAETVSDNVDKESLKKSIKRKKKSKKVDKDDWQE